jgi:hypothetical protein
MRIGYGISMGEISKNTFLIIFNEAKCVSGIFEQTTAKTGKE